MNTSLHRRWQLGLLIALLLASVLSGARAQTAAGCSVSYKVPNEWPGGFQADVAVTNTGSAALSAWTLTWTFAGDQKVTSAWNTALTQSGASVTAHNVDYNASLPAGGSQSFGFQATFGSSNPAPTSFALNGTTCTGPSATTPTSQAPTATPVPTTATPAPATPTQSPAGAIQAETALLGGGAAVESTNAGYNGSGYVNFPATGGSLEFRNLDGGAGGSVALRFRVALGATTARTGRVLVNGAAQDVTFNPTGAWTTWAVQSVTATFAPGATNTVRVESTGTDVANIDELSVGPPTPVTATPVPSTPTRTPAPPTATPAPPTATPAPATQLNFDFGPGPVEPGYTQVLASTGYSAARGYGFLDPSKVAERDRGTPDNLRRDFCLPGDTAFRVDLPNADYQVTYISGDALAATAMSVRAEGITKTLNLAVAAGSFSQQTFNISLIDGHLDLEFVGAGPRINALQIKRLPARAAGARPTVYIAGDSTVQTYSASYAPQAGWGQFIANYFTTDVAFVNKAIGGRSSKSFVLEGRLDEILGQIRPNDYLFVQMGHNDATKSRPERYTDPQTTYKQYLKMYLDGARQRGATPVLITPVGRLNYKNGVFVNDFTAYTTAMKELAAAENVKLIDLMSKSLAYYTSIGYNETYTLFMVSVNGTDYTHFTEKGANQIARLVSEGVREINVPISRFKK